VFTFSFLAVLSSCAQEATEEPDLEATAEAIAKTVVAEQLTEIAQAAATRTPTRTPTRGTPTTAATTSSQILPAATSFQASNTCLAASLVDESVPDNTVMGPGEGFQKTWTLQNTGTCTWTESFALVHNRGPILGAPARNGLTGSVAPGQSIVFALNMVAPSTPGTHTSFWELESTDGTRFGVGINGGIPFWVQIGTPGPTPTPRVKDTEAIARGSARANGTTGTAVLIGDNVNNLASQGFASIVLGNMPATTDVVSVLIDIDSGIQLNGDPFATLGCLRIYAHDYGALDGNDYTTGDPGIALWSYCSVAELQAGANRFGGEAAMAALEQALASGSGQFQIRLQFDNEHDGDNTQDSVQIGYIFMKIFWILPE
jgi:hypothetical protein